MKNIIATAAFAACLVAPTAAVPSSLSLKDQGFVLIGPTPLRSWNVQSGPMAEPWVRIECRSGERRSQDSVNVNRVGLDGYIDRFPVNKVVREEFSFIPGQNSRAVKAGQWLNFHEIHTTTLPGDIEQSGPLTFTMEWSAGAAKSVFRISRSTAIFRGTSIVGKKPTVLYQGDLKQGGQYDFIVKFYEHPTNGFVAVWINRQLVVNYRGPFGYGGGRRSYPQFRIYRAQRAETAVTHTKILSTQFSDPS